MTAELLVSEAPEQEANQLFKRYEFTENGVSPRVIPGVKNGIHHVTGVEHDQTGRPSESTENRQRMMDKRLEKLKHIQVTDAIKFDAPHEEARSSDYRNGFNWWND